MKIIGKSSWAAASSRCRSRPLNPGRRTSSTRQPGTSALRCCRNSRADAKVVTCSPTDRRSRCSASRIETSSSTTKIMASTVVMTPSRHCTRAVEARCCFDPPCSAPLALPGCLRPGRGFRVLAGALLRRRPQGKPHSSARPVMRHCPQLPPVLLDNRTTDRQPHPQPLRLRSVKRREDRLELLRGNPHPGVLDCRLHCVRSLLTRPDDQLTRALGHPGHRFNRVQHEVEQHLLHLHPIAPDGRQGGGHLYTQGHPLADDFVLRQADNLVHELRQVQPRFLGCSFA